MSITGFLKKFTHKAERRTTMSETSAAQAEELIPDPDAVAKIAVEEHTAQNAERAKKGKKPLLIADLTTTRAQTKIKKAPKVAKPKRAAQAPASASKRKSKQIESAHGKWREGSVIYEIYKCFVGQRLMTMAQIHKQLCDKFPDRKPASLWNTVRGEIQLQPVRRKVKLGRDELGHYNVSIKGWSDARVHRPEVAEAIKERRAAAAEKRAKGGPGLPKKPKAAPKKKAKKSPKKK